MDEEVPEPPEPDEIKRESYEILGTRYSALMSGDKAYEARTAVTQSVCNRMKRNVSNLESVEEGIIFTLHVSDKIKGLGGRSVKIYKLGLEEYEKVKRDLDYSNYPIL